MSFQSKSPDYLLGHSDSEMERLMRQAQHYGELSEQLFRLAGLATSMRVIDLGCGPGDVSFIAARIVGPRGTVVGVDASETAIDVARQRARALALHNVHFVLGDITRVSLSELTAALPSDLTRFDALIGRFVLLYLRDPAAALRRILPWLRTSGIVAFQEFDMSSASSEPRCELYETSVERIKAAFARSRLDPRLGLRQWHIFRAAGLSQPALRSGGYVDGGPHSLAYEAIAEVTRTLLPVMEATGIATAAEVDLPSLAERLRAEAVERDAVQTTPALIGASARVAEHETAAHGGDSRLAGSPQLELPDRQGKQL